MNDLPSELLQYINDKLDFFDQLNFKCTDQTCYKNIQIKLPYLLMFDNFGRTSEDGQIIPRKIYRLDEFEEPFFYYGHNECEVIVLNPNKYVKEPPNISEFKYFDYRTDEKGDIDYIEIDEDYAHECCHSSFRFCGGYPDDNGYTISDTIVCYESQNYDSEYNLFNKRKFIQICIDRMNEIIKRNNSKKEYIQECMNQISEIYTEMISKKNLVHQD